MNLLPRAVEPEATVVEVNRTPRREIVRQLPPGTTCSTQVQDRVNNWEIPDQAGSWDRARRVVAKVEWHQGELFPMVGFVVTNLKWPSRRVVRFYNQRGRAEQSIKEGRYALSWTRLSCHDCVDNQVRLQLFALAYDLRNFLRRLALPVGVKHWSLTTLRDKLIKIGVKLVRRARYVTSQMAEVAIPQDLFRGILARIRSLADAVPVPSR